MTTVAARPDQDIWRMPPTNESVNDLEDPYADSTAFGLMFADGDVAYSGGVTAHIGN